MNVCRSVQHRQGPNPLWPVLLKKNKERKSMKILMVAAGLASAYAVWVLVRRSRPESPSVYSSGEFDALDEAIDDSFPASDPPSTSGAHA